MSIYIPNVEFPKKDKYMAIVVDRDGLVYPSLTDAVLNQNKIAEAQQVMKHGRLIDTDSTVEVELYDDEHEEWNTKFMSVETYLGYCYNEVPTIIEGDGT